MPSLEKILTKADIITEAASDFGFEDIRLYCDPKSSSLQLLLKARPNSDQYNVPLEAWLEKQLDIQVLVMQEENLKKLYKTSIIQQSASLLDIAAIERLYQNKLSDIHIDKLLLDVESQNHRARSLHLAERILSEQKKPGVTVSTINFFSSAIEEKELPSSISDTKLKRKVSELVHDVEENNFLKILENMPKDSFEKLEQQLFEVKKIRFIENQVSPTAKVK